MARSMARWGVIALSAAVCMLHSQAAAQTPRLSLTWDKNFLHVRGPRIPGGEIVINYLEAYCRPGSTDRDWGKTVIPHAARKIYASPDGAVLKLKDTLQDAVIVEHTLTAGTDAVTFQVVAHNPTQKASEADWAQPCIRVDRFTGCPTSDARTRVPRYVQQCFLFLDGKLTRLPTHPWAAKARYTPGQVYCPRTVNRRDVNPRPLSVLVPSHGLVGCYSKDERMIMAVAWEPYQELFQGVVTCIHSDFRIGGLKPGETKHIRGKLYIVPAKADQLFQEYLHDFPEQAKR